MALRTDLPRIPVQEDPTIWNLTMGKWAFWSSMLAGIPAQLAFGVDASEVEAITEAIASSELANHDNFILRYGDNQLLAIPPEVEDNIRSMASTEIAIRNLPADAVTLGATAVGAGIGGTKGKAQTQDELQHGKIVRDPTFWNKKILSNLMAVSIPTAITIIGLGLVGLPITVMAVGAVGCIASLAYGIAGGFEQKGKMKEELSLALDIQKQQQLGVGQARTHEVSAGRGRGHAQEHNGRGQTQVSAQEVALLEARMKEGGAANFIEMLQQQAAQAAAEPQKA